MEFIEEWINRNDNMFVNAPSALQSMGAKGYYQAVQQIVLMETNSLENDPNAFFTSRKNNTFVFGTLGIGKAYHPWDDLKNCKCGGQPFMVGKDGEDFHSGKPFRIICTKCNRSTTSNDNISIIKDDWNESTHPKN